MGIKHLKKLIDRYAPDSYKVVKLSEFKGKKVAVDITGYLFRYISRNENNLYKGIYHMMELLLNNGILPICVFDGKPTKDKSDNAIKKRKDKNSKNKEKFANKMEECVKEYGTDDIYKLLRFDKDLAKLERQIVKIPSKDNKYNCKLLLDYMGIPYLVANGEADILCSKLYKENYVDFVISEDYDMLPYQCKIYARDFKASSSSVTVFYLDKILKDFDVNYNQFLDICILAGCDYSNTIKRLGVMTAYIKIKEYKTIEKIIEQTSEDKIPNNFNYKNARNIFINSHLNEKKIDSSLLVKGFYNKNKLKSFFESHNIFNFIN